MKEKVKIWSRRRLLGAFLAFVGLSAMATAQSLTNGTVHANCGTELSVVTRTLNQMDSTNGTVIPIVFDVASNPGLIGDNYYIVAGTNGSLLSLEQTACDGIGDGLTFMGTSDASYTGTNNTTLASAVGQIPANGKIYLRVKATTEGNVTGVYKLGIFVEDIAGTGATNCFSDVHYITINVFQNVYASLNLHTNGTAKEYICSGTTTLTDIGFDLCGIPTGITDFTLYYDLDMTPTTLGNGTVTGTSVADAANGDGIYSRAFTLTAGHDGEYSMRIGQQTLANTSASHINTVTYAFAEGLDKFYVEYRDGAGRTVQLPILFITNTDNCTGTPQTYTTDQLSKVFTVNLAPAFTIDALAYTTEERTTPSTTTFCQGRIAYLDAVTSSEEGTMPDKAYSWTLTDNIDGATNIKNPKSKELVVAGDDTYTFTVTAQWDDQETEGLASGNWATVNEGNGCKATDNVVIDVTAAPILHIATNENTEGDGRWNATDVITNAEVCSGDEIKILTADALGTIGTSRQDTLYTSIYIKTNGASIAYTIDPADNDALKAYSVWRSTAAATTGTLSIGNADGTTPGHYLNNETANNPAIITYIVENAGTTSNTCPLVRSDGTSLNLGEANEGKVRIQFPVKARPQFNLSAN